MPPLVILLILISVAMSAGAQIVLKFGMSSEMVRTALSQSSLTSKIVAVACNYWILAGLGMYFLSAVVWLLVLARVQVSLAYPFVGLGFVLTLFLGWWLMGDTVGPTRLIGTMLVVTGVVLLARGG
jgi:multidrug transporter EmrE-like cation transporter